MILFYRPELDSPPMDPNCTLGFSFIEGLNVEHIALESGANEVPDEVWDKIRDYPVTQTLLSLGALRIVTEAERAATEKAAEVATPTAATAMTLETVSIPDALSMIEDSFESKQLERWLSKESRIKVRNAIAKRLKAIEDGAA